ncbi:predicted protein [Aspergillus nidulans FGSC A4]|nr:predicted protein [Aspergillus nidulans FGSC A4]|eukprot:XP_657773.1 predicted protein [Aspergillus nidulans FGSC A4]
MQKSGNWLADDRAGARNREKAYGCVGFGCGIGRLELTKPILPPGLKAATDDVILSLSIGMVWNTAIFLPNQAETSVADAMQIVYETINSITVTCMKYHDKKAARSSSATRT